MTQSLNLARLLTWLQNEITIIIGLLWSSINSRSFLLFFLTQFNKEGQFGQK